MFSKLDSVLKRYEELERLLSMPETASDRIKFVEFSKERAQLEPIVQKYLEYKKINKEIEDKTELLNGDDKELRELAKEELARIKDLLPSLEQELKVLLIPKDPNDEKNIILEVRAGTGGDEAAIFAADLFRMYSRYAERNRWKVEILNSNPICIGGYKEIIAMISEIGRAHV